MAENGEIAELDINVVAECPIIPVTRFEDDGSVGVEWVGRCWAWLEEDGPPELRDVVVRRGGCQGVDAGTGAPGPGEGAHG